MAKAWGRPDLQLVLQELPGATQGRVRRDGHLTISVKLQVLHAISHEAIIETCSHTTRVFEGVRKEVLSQTRPVDSGLK